jgi:D-alanyl-D-alanine carboxypeptidase (penicillin-binding protein 5/6)
VLLLLAAMIPFIGAPVAFARGSGGPGAGTATAVATTAPPLPPPGAWILVDADTGNVIDAGNDHTPMRPASLTKVVTALAAAAVIPPDATVPVSARAAGMPADNLNMKAGQVWTFTDALHAMMLSSANDAAVALAEKAGGTVEGFAKLFAGTASTLGMRDSPTLQDPAGLDDEFSVGGGNLISARDLAIAARALLASPELSAVVAEKVYTFDGPDKVHHRLGNHNRMLITYPGAIGVKTGYTKRAGQCLITAATRDGRTMISVVLKAPGSPYDPSAKLLDKGFATPVAAETAADRLPPVPKDLGSALNPPPPDEGAKSVGPGEAASGPLPPANDAGGAADAGGAGPNDRTLATFVKVASAGPFVAVELAVGGAGLLRLRARRRQRKRKRTRAKKKHPARKSPAKPPARRPATTRR